MQKIILRLNGVCFALAGQNFLRTNVTYILSMPALTLSLCVLQIQGNLILFFYILSLLSESPNKYVSGGCLIAIFDGFVALAA